LRCHTGGCLLRCSGRRYGRDHCKKRNDYLYVI